MTHKNLVTTLILFLLIVFCVQHGSGVSQKSEKDIILGTKIVLRSEVLDEDRTIQIRMPKDYGRSNQKYPVLYLLDSEFFFYQAASAVEFLSECGYIRNKPMPQAILVGVVNVDRNRDYTPTYAPRQLGRLYFPTSGKAGPFLEFLKTELFPFIEENYRTQNYRILAGWSLGGLLTVHTYLNFPDLFSAYLAISPSLWWDEDLYVKHTKSFIAKNKIPNKPLVVTVGSLEGGDIGRSVRDGFISMMNSKLGENVPFQAIEILNENHNLVPYKALYEGLLSLYSDWMMPGDVVTKGFQAIKSFYDALSEKYGYSVDIPESAYTQLANYLFNQGEEKECIELAERYVKHYPESSYARFFLGFWYEQTGEMECAKRCYKEALEIENAYPEPDSEKIVLYTTRLKDIERNNPSSF
jgi:predicted alpha/beta superfamily hydrolase